EVIRGQLYGTNLLHWSIFLWGRPPCGGDCGAKVGLGAAGILPGGRRGGGDGEEAAEGRKCEGGAGNGFGSRVGYTIQTCDPSVSRPAVRWGPQFSSSAPPRSPAPSFDHFPFGPASLRRPVPSSEEHTSELKSLRQPVGRRH